jgi:hypothetical protein
VFRAAQNYEQGFEVFTAVTMKNAVFWDAAQCWFIINRLPLKRPTLRHIPEDGILQSNYYLIRKYFNVQVKD